MKKTSTSPKILWHRLLGKLLEELLSPVNISVFTDFPVMSDSPKTDILLLRRHEAQWTAPQLARLPDGIRHSHAGHLLIEFKYTESLNEDALLQALGYDTCYKRTQRLKSSDIQSFLLSAKTPQSATLKEFGYQPSSSNGVFLSQERCFEKIILLSLNDLADEPHNAFVKCFASRQQEKQKAFDLLKQSELPTMTPPLEWLLTGLQKIWFNLTGEYMREELTPEKVIEMGKQWGDWYLSVLPPEQRLAGLAPAERLKGLKPQEVFSQFKPEDLENYLNQLKHQKTAMKNTQRRRP